MSSILKALKKLEQEKALRRDGGADISREILHGQTRRKKQYSWQWAAAITTIILLFAVVAILMTRGTATVKTEPGSAPLLETRLPAPPAPATAGKLPAEGSSAKPADSPRVETAPVRKPTGSPAPDPAPAKTQMPPALPTQPATRPPALPETAPQFTAPPPKAEPVRKPNPPATTEPIFAVSGIAWNKDSADRLAIVNGQPLTTGAFLDGAVVEEIFPDRVRFSQGGKTFEVHLGKAGKTH